MFKVRKSKIWKFLQWLATYNHLYSDIHLDSAIMDDYPDDGLLPGIEHCVFEDFTEKSRKN